MLPGKATQERIISLDIIRGIAVLGIPLMNIQSFSMPSSAYINPTSFGDFSGLNWLVWLLTHILADSKFMGIFSILFGAGVLIFCQSAENKHQHATKLHYRRNFWLLAFGLLHAYFFWYGDILVHYALCAFIVFWFRHLPPKRLLISAAIMLTIGSGYNLLVGYGLPYFPPEAIAEIGQAWSPDEAEISREIAAYRGGFELQNSYRWPQAFFMQSQLFLTNVVWRVCAMMCLGMALYKLNILNASRDSAFYLRLSGYTLTPGLALVCYGAYQHISHGFSLEYSFFIGSQFNYWGSVLMSVGYISLVCWWIKSGAGRKMINYLGAVGRMAFTHYLSQSLIFTTIFYGHGLGLFAALSLSQSMLLVLLVVLLQLAISPWWLRHFYYGPLEWIWRCLTYCKRQPLAKTDS